MTQAEQEHLTRGLELIGGHQTTAIFALENQSCTGATRIARVNLKKAQQETQHLIGYLELCSEETTSTNCNVGSASQEKGEA